MVPGSSRAPPEPPEERPGLFPQTRRQDERTRRGAMPATAGREGVVIGAGRYRSTVRIMFDGFRSATSLHRTYIEPVAGKEGASSRDRC